MNWAGPQLANKDKDKDITLKKSQPIYHHAISSISLVKEEIMVHRNAIPKPRGSPKEVRLGLGRSYPGWDEDKKGRCILAEGAAPMVMQDPPDKGQRPGWRQWLWHRGL